MPDIFLQNTLTKNKDKFEPLKAGEVSMYTCGPTVYNYLHIGNLRAYVFADILKRTLQYNGYKVKHVMNVTDIGHLTDDVDEGEDKMVKALRRENKPMSLTALREVGDFYFEKAKEDMNALNIIPADLYPFASDEIPSQIELVEKLLEKEFAYKISDGIYFDTEKLKSYGRLGGSASEDHSRIGVNSEKKDSRDFSLWKFADKNGIGFDAPFGKGFPGWHIECSAMSMRYLGEQFDIHTGGIDHIQVHHNNEIAQSEAVTGKILANYWLHNDHLTIGGNKMAKSGEFLILKILKEKGISPLAYRYFLLQSRYSTRMDYSEDAIKGAQTAVSRLTDFVSNTSETGQINSEYKNIFNEAINDDLDTPKAIALIWQLIKDSDVSDADKKATILDFDEVLGLGLGDIKKETKPEVPKKIFELAEKRRKLKESGDFAAADEIRKQIEKENFRITDNSSGSYTITYWK